MSNWKYILDVRDIWELEKENKISLNELSRKIYLKLKILNVRDDFEYDDLVYEFEVISEEKTLSTKEFDIVMEMLYDWGDSNHNCWVSTK